jgi:hypothetical protein
MQTVLNLLDVDSLVEEFIEEHVQGIATLHRVYFHNDDQLSIRALTEELKDELRTGCVTFLNKDAPIQELDSYLFYIVNDFCKKKSVPLVKKKTEYLCPGCLFLGKEQLTSIVNKLFKCNECEDALRKAVDPKKIVFFRTFFKHNKNGYHCEDCDRFIPHPTDNSPIISCPYFDCFFVGAWSSLRRMHHPTTQRNIELLTLDATYDGKSSLKDSVKSEEPDALAQIELEESFTSKVKLLTDVIDYQSNNVPYSSSDFTIKHKYLVYQAFSNLLRSDPVSMVDYLLHHSRSGGFQHKVFQEYIDLLEKSLPFSFKKAGKIYKIESLLDADLNLFDGISTFKAIVTDKLEIKNGTTEFYVGGRKAAYTKNYYIGKLLSVVASVTNTVLTDQVVEYSFSKIKVRDIVPGTEVTITHLRVPPHYQMGGMVHVNRVRKKIVDRANLILNKDPDVI